MGTDMDRPDLHGWRFGRFRVDLDSRRLTDDTGAGLGLTGRAFDVLAYLIGHHDRVVSKDELLAAVWPGVVVEDNNLNQAVSTIRRVLGDSRNAPEFLATVPGRGYRFIARLQDESPQVPEELLAPPTAPGAEPPQSRSPTVWYRRPRIYVAAGLAVLVVAGLSIVGLRRESVSATANAAINPDAYALYEQGQQLMSNLTVADAEKAVALFRRSTILDPNFARGYLALGQAQVQASRLRGSGEYAMQIVGGPTKEALAEAQRAFDRSLDLNPSLGEAWIERAGLSADPVEAEKLYRKGLRLAPNYGIGYMRFSEFLFGQYRKGEASEMIDRARLVDPQTPALHLRKAFMLMVTRSDVAGHDRLVREALAINPHLHPALIQLASSRHEYSGEFADAVRIIEQSIALDPQSALGRQIAARIYLDVDDPAAATSVMRDSPQSGEATVEIAQYQRDRHRAAVLARSSREQIWGGGPTAPMAEAIRDDAVVTGDYASALTLLKSASAKGSGGGAGMRMWSRGFTLVYAHTLIRAGETQRGRDVVASLMVQIDSESIGRTKDWFSRERASAFAILGEDERALQELAASVQTGKMYRWWYLAELDPAYEHLRGDPRFQALARQAKEHRRSQRALVEELRRKGAVPKRTS